MGVPKFYRWVSERYPCLSQVVSEAQVPEFDNLYLDMNGIIHCCSHPDDDDVMFRISEEQIFTDVSAYIDMLFKIIRPKRVFFMAIDGVAPRAKMNQQRARRFMSARNAEFALKKAIQDGVEIPEGSRFDSNCITPGTHFMVALHKHLDNWVQHKIETDPLWRQDGKLRVVLSGHDCPGEGEHKIMDFIRAERILPEYDPNTRHCMYGLDADLMMLGLSSHEPHFSLLREEVKFGRVQPSKKKGNDQVKRKEPKNVNFHLLHLQLFREYLEREFQALKTKISFPFDLENIIDDWVLMGFLIGNDFIPHLPNVHIHDDALPLLYKTYAEVLPTLDGYLNEKGMLNVQRFEKFLKVFSETDKKSFMERLENEEYLESKTGRPVASAKEGTPPNAEKEKEEELVAFSDPDMSSATDDDDDDDAGPHDTSNAAFVSSDEEDSSKQSNERPVTGGILSAEDALNAEMSNSQPDDYDPYEEEFQEKLKALEIKDMSDSEFENNVEKCWSTTINNQFKRHRRQYYKDKMKFGNISKTELKAQAEGYIRALQWNLHYYYHGCVSWNWYYPFHYSPFISDLINFHEVDMNFELSTPFRPFEQLLAVLPAASAACLPYHLQQLMKDPNSPIHDFYPTDFETDLNGKVNDWEAVVLVPFINQDRLLEAIKSKENLLSNEEKARNAHGPHILYTCDISKSDGKRAIRTTIDKNAFRIDKSTVIHGLLSGVKLDVHFPGFPTMCHIPHTATLDYAGVKVFNTGKSKKESIILKPTQRKELEKPFETLSEELLNKQVYIDWPMLALALVSEIWTVTEKYFMKDGKIERKELDLDDQKDFKDWASGIRDIQMNRYAIDVGPISHIVFCRKFMGLSVTVRDGVVKRQKQWGSSIPHEMSRVALQVLVSNINIKENRVLCDIPIEEAYAVNSKVFVMQPSWDGFAHPAVVSEIGNSGTPECRIIVNVHIYKGADVSEVRQTRFKNSLHWFNSFEAGKRSGITTRLLTRITGTVYLVTESREFYESKPATTPRLNIGLNLKLTKQNKEVPDYSKRIQENGYWEFSNQAVQLLMEYRNKFRDLITYLEKAEETNEHYFAEDVWPKEALREKRVKELREYMKEVPTASIEKVECYSEYLDSQCIAALEKVLPKHDTHEVPIRKKSSINPAVLYRYALMDGKVMPDPEADFRLFDRVAYVVEGGTVPCGSHGTIIGLINNKLEVLFDRPFKDGYKIRSSLTQCYCVAKTQIINITFGKERKGKEEQKSIKKKPAQTQKFIETTSGSYTKWSPRMKPQAQTSTAKVTDFVPRILKDKPAKSQQNMKPVEKKVTETKPTAKSLSTEKVETVSTDAKKVELELSQMLGIGFNKTKSSSPTLHEHDKSGSSSVISFLQKGAWSTSNKTSVNATEVEPSSSAEKSKTKENDENQEKDEGDWEEVGEPVSVEQKIVFNSSQRGSLNSQPPRGFRQVNYGRGDNFNNYSGRSPRGFMQNSTFRQPQNFVNRGPSYFFGNSSTNPRGMQRGRVGNGYRNQNHEQLLNNSDLVPSAVSRPRFSRGRGGLTPKVDHSEVEAQPTSPPTTNPTKSEQGAPPSDAAPTENYSKLLGTNKPRKSRLAANFSST